MNIHTNKLTAAAIRECVPEGCYLAGHYDRISGIDWASIHQYGSRSHHIAYSVRLSGSSKSTMTNLPDKAATYDEWGFFLAEIFARDPQAKCGGYNGREDFIVQTDGKFVVGVQHENVAH